MSGLSMEALGGQLKSVAESKVKRDVVLDAIATAENVSVSDEELDKKVEEVAAAYGMEVEKLKEELTKAGNLNHFMENLKIDIRIHKTVDILVENTK
jgi:trigger factor